MGHEQTQQVPTNELALDLRVPARPDKVARAREALDHLGLPGEVVEDAKLLVTELITNSIRHSGLTPYDDVRVMADWSGTRLRITVRDRSGVPAPAVIAGAIRPPPGAESGWGLYLVDRMAARWGVDGHGGYWFDLEIGPRQASP